MTDNKGLPEVDGGYSGYFIVAFVDLLGTDERNAEIKAAGCPPEMLEQEVKKVKTFQRNFYGFLKAIEDDESLRESQRPEELKEKFGKLKGNDVVSYAFSDAVIFYASLNTQQGRTVPVQSCFNLLSALVYAQLWALSRGKPFRGGVEIGCAAVFNGDQILGPALSDAVRLEKQAQFPRIIVGQGAQKYLQLHAKLPSNVPENHANREYAGLCEGLFYESNEPRKLCEPDNSYEDNISILSLDVQADWVLELVGNSQQHLELIAKAINFTESQIQRFANQEDEKLACRYRCLLDYLRVKRTK